MTALTHNSHTKLVNWQHSFETGNVRVPYTYLPRAVTDILLSTFPWLGMTSVCSKTGNGMYTVSGCTIRHISSTNRAILHWKGGTEAAFISQKRWIYTNYTKLRWLQCQLHKNANGKNTMNGNVNILANFLWNFNGQNTRCHCWSVRRIQVTYVTYVGNPHVKIPITWIPFKMTGLCP